MFLFDKYRTGRQNFESGNEKPKVIWKTDLNTNPVYGAESTAVLDKDGNIYFGSHNGNFYSLEPEGEIRWTFTTKMKIYSSPLLLDDKVYFAGGDGFFYCISSDGKLMWKFNMGLHKKTTSFRKRLFAKIAHLPFTFDWNRKRNITFRSWSSPNNIDNQIFITGFGKGLFCFNPEGDVIWSYDLGFPRYQLSGVAIDEINNVYLSSRAGNAYSFSKDGKLLWSKKIKRYWEPWGNPAVCNINKSVYFFFSRGEKKGIIHTTDYEGNTKWVQNIGSIRGSCCVDWEGKYLYCCDLDGYIYKIESATGNVINKKQLTTAQRGLWITPTIDKNGDLLISTKDGAHKGRVLKINPQLELIWEFNSNKVLSIPVILANKELIFGSWDGFYYKIKS